MLGNTRLRSIDDALSLTANAHRRQTLRHLIDHPTNHVTVVELVEAINGPHTDCTDRELRISLYHVHLPKLESAGVIEFDAPSETIRYRGDAAVEALIETIDESVT